MVSEERATPASAAEAPHGRSGAVLSAQGLLRLLLALLAFWTAFSGLALVFFQSGSAATIGGGLEGGQGEAAQRLLGVHLLVLAPLYALLAWEPVRFRLLMWVPYVAQGGVVAVTAFDIITGDRDFTDGALPLIVAATFLVLLLYVWRAARPPEPAIPSPAIGAPPPEEEAAVDGEWKEVEDTEEKPG
ncbi:MAG: hypothetical protein WD939_03015 [Dehalococcoidia bacterium]